MCPNIVTYEYVVEGNSDVEIEQFLSAANVFIWSKIKTISADKSYTIINPKHEK